MRAIVFDLEFTKTTIPRIIQIGAVTVDLQRLEVIDCYTRTANSGEKVCSFIEELTGISQARIDASARIEEVLEDFFKWLKKPGQPKAVYSWGEGDLVLLRMNAASYEVPAPRIVGANIKEFFKLVKLAKGEKVKGGLKRTMENFELSFYGREHDAFIDSFNTARLVFQLLDQLKNGYETKKKKNYKDEKDSLNCEQFKEICLKKFNYSLDYFSPKKEEER